MARIDLTAPGHWWVSTWDANRGFSSALIATALGLLAVATSAGAFGGPVAAAAGAGPNAGAAAAGAGPNAGAAAAAPRGDGMMPPLETDELSGQLIPIP